MEAVRAEANSIEDVVFAASLPTYEVQKLFGLRRELLQLRTAAVPLAEVCKRLEHAEVKQIDAEMQPLSRDVRDHVSRMKDEINSLREILTFTFEASLMVGQAQQKAIARRLAPWAAILAVPTAVAGIYEMNVEHMPELKWRIGYPLALSAIALICSVMYWRLKKNDRV